MKFTLPFALFGLLLAAAPGALHAADKPKGPQALSAPIYQDRLSQIGDDFIVVLHVVAAKAGGKGATAARHETERRYKVTPRTHIQCEGRTVPLSELKPEMAVTVSSEPATLSGDKTEVAFSISARAAKPIPTPPPKK